MNTFWTAIYVLAIIVLGIPLVVLAIDFWKGLL